MIFTKTSLEGVYLITPELKKDARGYFTRIYCQDELKGHAIHFPIVQMNQSKSAQAGTIRGLHMQKAPHSEAKLIQCLQGSIFDVVVDLRRKSKTHGRWLGEILSQAKKISKAFHHIGNLDVDFIEEKNGNIYFIDFNPRFGRLSPFTHLSGCNYLKILSIY